ncbi:MAG: rhomboid family intramembrane serine protease [Bacteroidales bacterium]|jgi:membrane associated rhomboid family serine protease|nr:rhomboid family intramembrane serine protease [Bacteroidales bacterium]MDD4385686.1 rhomboid family intramembrane serine protease [Bacteroidales bacterium]MDY0197941.1 rhomboid family intramembrane serine protease [Tenuifilaceae bacterium]
MNHILQEIKQSFKTGGTLVKLIYINLGVFLAFNILKAILFLGGIDIGFTLSSYIAIPAHLPTLASRPWTIITYMFFHEGFIHILFNMLWLYWMGRIFLSFMSERKLLGVYIMGGMWGALLYILFYNIFPVFGDSLPLSFALGASAAVYAIVFAAVAFSPNLSLNLFLIGPIRLKYIGVALIVIDVISIAGSNAGGHIAHLGGALFGVLFIYFQKQDVNLVQPVNWVIDAFTTSPSAKKRKKMKVDYSKPKDDFEYNRVKAEQQAEIDRILDKISKGGYESLTSEEKETLFRMKGK